MSFVAWNRVSNLFGRMRDAIQKSQSTVAMFGYVFLSCSFLAAALVLCAIGVSSENERIERENRKVKRIPHHTSEWRDAQ